MRVIDEAWESLEVGRTTAVVGGTIPPAPTLWHEERVRADGGASGALLSALRAALADELDDSLLARAGRSLSARLRQRIFGDASLTPVQALVELINASAQDLEQPLALVVEGLEHADAESLRVLDELVTWPGRFGAAVALSFESMPRDPDAPVARLLASVKRVEGPRGLVGVEDGPETWAELHPVPFTSDEDVPTSDVVTTIS